MARMSLLIAAATILVLASPAFCANRTVDNSCPSDAVQEFGSKYFRVRDNFCYQFVKKPQLTYEDAKAKCQSYQGTLAMPKTKDVNDFLLQEMRDLPSYLPMWIGMHDRVKDDSYVWEDGTAVQPWGNMHSGNGGLFGDNEDCIALNPSDGLWHDYRCDVIKFLSTLTLTGEMKMRFICQYPIKDD